MKFRTLLTVMIFTFSSFAGCISEEIEDNSNSKNEKGKEDLVLLDNNNNEIDINPNEDILIDNSLDESETKIKNYTAEEVLELVGIDDSPNAKLNIDAPKIGHDKFGIQIIMDIPANTIPSSLTEGINQNIEIISTNKYDNLDQKISHDIQAKLPMGSWSINVILSETQAPHPEITNAGVVNRIVTNEANFQPEAEWLIDYNWDYNHLNWNPNIENIAEIFSPPKDCNGHGFLDGNSNSGQQCICDEGFKWDNGNFQTCVSKSEGTEIENNKNDEADDNEFPINIPEPTAAELFATEWNSTTDEISGVQSFNGVVEVEKSGSWSISLSIIPTIPAKLTGLIMTNETESYDMIFTYGDEIKIDFIHEDTEGWNKKSSDLSFEIERTDQAKIIESNDTEIIEGCTDSEAINYNQNANQDDGTCTYHSSSKPRILALHGGGDSAQGLESQRGMQDLMEELSEFEFVFVDSPENDGVWIKDPPGGKGEGTDDPNWADTSINFLDSYIENNGPFYGLMGYSQGAAMIPVYLAYSDHSFEKVMHFNGYLETGHRGLMNTINANSPFVEDSLIFEGEDDAWFGYGSAELVEHYTNSIHLVGDAGHHLPYSNDRAFNDVVTFFRDISEPSYGCTDSYALNYDSEADEDDGSCEYEDSMQEFEINTFLFANLSGNIEVPKSQLKLHIQTAEGTTQFNVIQDGEIGKWTDSQLNTWTINWNCNNVNASLQTQILVHSECGILMTKTWIGYTNNSIDIIENDPLGFEIYLFDTWANDYTGDVYMPSFTILISLIGLLGASFLLRRKRID